MADISSIVLPDGSSYDFKDTTARQAIPYGAVDSTSTSTVFTATVPGITELKDGTVVLLKNGVVTSAANFTININGLGAKPAYSNMATGNETTPTAPTRETTIFNINYTLMFIYCEDLVNDGAWICYRGYDANTNTIGYQLRTNSMTMPVSGALYRYRLLFTSVDGRNWIPANTTNSTDANAEKTTNSAYFDPFGEIRYYGGTSAVSSGSRPSASALWQQYVFNIGYSFNKTGAAPTLTSWRPVYLKCTINPNGGVRFASTPYVQGLPTAADLTHVYIYLGVAYSATNVEMAMNHPVYYHDGTSIKIWNGVAIPRTAEDVGAISAPSGVNNDQILVYNSSGSAWVAADLNQELDSAGAAIYSIQPVSGTTDQYTIACDPAVVATEIASCRKVLFILGSSYNGFVICDIIEFDESDGHLVLQGKQFSGWNTITFNFYASSDGFYGSAGIIYGDNYIFKDDTKRIGAIVEVSGTGTALDGQTIITDLNGEPVTYLELTSALTSVRDLLVGIAINGIDEAYVGRIVYYNNTTSTIKVSCLTAYNDLLMTFVETNDVLVMTESSLRPLEAIAAPGSPSDGDFLVYDGTNDVWVSQSVTIPTNAVTYTQNNSVSVAGITKTTYTYGKTPIYAPNGIIIGGTAAAGLVTRGVCGINSPTGGGACQKDNLYLNYDGDNTYRSTRQVIIQAGATGTHYGSNLYQYAAARGDAVKGYIDNRVSNYGMLPTPAAADEGKFLRVVNGAWAAVSLPSASGVSF